jgi:hypothetical protein
MRVEALRVVDIRACLHAEEAGADEEELTTTPMK